MATPTRRPAHDATIGTAAASWSSAGPPIFARRKSLSNASGGICSPAHPSNNRLPSVRLAAAAVVSRSGGRARRPCACSPMTHLGSFYCVLHRGGGLHLNDVRWSAMANSLVCIAAVEGGDHVRRALASLIRPSSHHQRRRAAYHALSSRLSIMSTATADASEASPSPSPPQ